MCSRDLQELHHPQDLVIKLPFRTFGQRDISDTRCFRQLPIFYSKSAFSYCFPSCWYLFFFFNLWQIGHNVKGTIAPFLTVQFRDIEDLHIVSEPSSPSLSRTFSLNTNSHPSLPPISPQLPLYFLSL